FGMFICAGSQLAPPLHSPRTHSGTPEPTPFTQVVKNFFGSTLGSRGSPHNVLPSVHCSGTQLAVSLFCWQISFTPHCVSFYASPSTPSRIWLAPLQVEPSAQTEPRQRPASQ